VLWKMLCLLYEAEANHGCLSESSRWAGASDDTRRSPMPYKGSLRQPRHSLTACIWGQTRKVVVVSIPSYAALPPRQRRSRGPASRRQPHLMPSASS